MSAEWYFLLAFAFGTSLVVAVTPIVKKIGIATKQVDKPDLRKIHTFPIVRIGGGSIFIAIMLSLGILYGVQGWAFLDSEAVNRLIIIILGGCAFFAMGLADDIWDLSAFYRLRLQFLVIVGLWWQGLRVDLSFLPWDNSFLLGGLSLLITFLWLAGVANAVNWIDGMDGLAGGVTGIIAFATLFITLENGNYGVALLMATTAGSAIAFLWYNFHPADIFMGDGGSNFLGFLLAASSLAGIANEPGLGNTLAPFVLLAVPIGDMLVVITARLRAGKSPFIADQIHIHHRLLAKGISQTMTALFLYTLTLWVGTLALVFCNFERPWIYFAPATVVLLGMTWQVQRSRKQKKEL
ncbi:undecaprenyl/decaprenyl-phosphate alpha-N-acetylglucosaminyl 1-phosphate transferase [Euhalothece natronophila Z-M001]|uniref:Undecaprenyl/decaprenyl-phosphate alpha-N-acetylglucosaminyl 1-phosphate transferase n=1 Tax=Euhalothece natronophila Z-M001 TaxID=522448 RepID=A0A5B8NN16_9CHRO|nr:MraY family glycosyltransferase [Euhalothece natronophila]QDZ40347.1 undecaprenyl/decaprenyl-phosphate alpha-N-acetylglucosaminyl 1-phosphate transferase [Euhalothece natronophila Z-M001]